MTRQYVIIGMMSGTSFDGVDLAACHFYWDNKWKYSLLAAETLSYPVQIIDCILKMQNFNIEYLVFKKREIIYSQYLSVIIKRFIQKYKINDISCLAIHGHTIFHNPKQKITVQAANLTTIAAQLKLPVIGNFRELDVMRGGQGAPLAPFGQQLFEGQIFINFGGVANIGYKSRGWDINYCNLYFNFYANKISKVQYDEGGNIGRKGNKNQQLLINLNKKFSNKSNRPSLSRQGFQKLIDWIQEYYPKLKDEDALTTFYYFLSQQIHLEVQKINQSQQTHRKFNVVCTGGGAHNIFLLELLNQKTPNLIEYIIPEESIVSFKEAIIFAYLALKYIENEDNCLNGIGGSMIKGNSTLFKS